MGLNLGQVTLFWWNVTDKKDPLSVVNSVAEHEAHLTQKSLLNRNSLFVNTAYLHDLLNLLQHLHKETFHLHTKFLFLCKPLNFACEQQ